MAKTRDKSTRSATGATSGAASADAAAPAPPASPSRRRLILILIIVIIILVEAFLVIGLWERHSIITSRTRGQAASKNQDWDTALKYYGKLLKIAPVSVPVNKETAEVYMGMGRYEDAIRHYETALSTDQQAKGLNAQVGLAYIALEQPEKAYPYFERELQIDPQNTDALFYVGRQHFEKGEWRQAGARFQLVATHPEYGEPARDFNRRIEEKARAAASAAATPATDTPAPTQKPPAETP